MKLYYFPVAPNPTRVRTYIREKGIELEEFAVNLREGEQNSPEHLARNPRAALPVLEMDNGDYITESLPIIEYLEELYPEPAMIGATPETRAKTREMERLAETNILNTMGRLVHTTNSPLGLPANPAVAAMEQEKLPAAFQLFDERLQGRTFLMGDGVTIADCTLFAGLFFGEFFGVDVPEEYARLREWYTGFKQRPSTQI
jgi:glutathione S-transferase